MPYFHDSIWFFSNNFDSSIDLPVNFLYSHLRYGRLAQLVERLVYTQNVGSSSLSAPMKTQAFSLRFFLFFQGYKTEVKELTVQLFV